LPKYLSTFVTTLCGIVIAGSLLAVAGATPVHAQTCSWTGNWDTGTFGVMNLSQSGTDITGGYVYTGSDGKAIQGTLVVYIVDSATAAGAWLQTNNPNPGGLVWTMSPDCKTFTGQYALPSTPTGSWDGPWNGTRTG